MFEEPTFELDHQKLKDVVHYICSKCSPEELGNVKLHKILYFSDMLHFQSTGQPLTGVEYQKQKFGPTARHLGWAVGQLISENKLRSEDRDYYGFAKRAYISLSAPRNDRIGNVTHLLDDVIDFVCARSAKEISELSHNVAPDYPGISAGAGNAVRDR